MTLLLRLSYMSPMIGCVPYFFDVADILVADGHGSGDVIQPQALFGLAFYQCLHGATLPGVLYRENSDIS